MQSKVFGPAANPFERAGYRLLLAGAVIVAVGLVLTSAVFFSYGTTLGSELIFGLSGYVLTAIGYMVQAVGFLLAFLGIALLHRPRR